MEYEIGIGNMINFLKTPYLHCVGVVLFAVTYTNDMVDISRGAHRSECFSVLSDESKSRILNILITRIGCVCV